MALATGSKLGPYEIIAPIGAGGMGEVWKARDTRLGRIVAIKVLPAHLSANQEVRARFEREARTISQLSHPYICSLHDIGRQDDINYLVMEYLEGETLAARIAKGPLPPVEVLRFGIEIANALECAHRSGIVHRDLKPGNIMMTKSGAKLMDFGLARSISLPAMACAFSESPTESRPLTAEGTIIGTFQYMAPEQLEGKEADPRTDLWALGCVLYEMATGKHAFEGTNQASLIAAILKEEPRTISELQPLAPPALQHLVRRCLAKDPGERWQSAIDVMHELEWIAEEDSQPGIPAPVAIRGRRDWFAWALMFAAIAVALVVFVMSRMTPLPPTPAPARFAVTAPPGMIVVNEGTSAAVSPDGLRLVFTVVDSAGTPRLWIRALDSLSARPLAGTENALLPFWSPDGRFIAFFAEGKLQKVSAGGGLPEVICDAPNGRGGSWNRDGMILFAPAALGPLMMVSADGGEPVEVARPDPALQETGLRFPCFLPDGGHYIYISLPRKKEGFEVYLGNLNSKQPKRIMAAGGAPVYVETGYLLFIRGNRLVAQSFDRRRMQPTGGVVLLDDAPPPSGFDGAPMLSASNNGVLIHAATSLPDTQLVWLDRSGRPLNPISLPPSSYLSPSISPDGRWATVTKANSPTSADLWLIDLQRSVSTRLTFDGLVASGGGYLGAVWSPDGSRVAYMRSRPGFYDVYQVLINGTGQPEPLVRSDIVFKTPAAWSPDGKYLVWTQSVESTQWDLWLMPMQGDRKPSPYLATPFDENTAAISPDGRWLAYDSNETGRPEVYVRSFPEPGEKHRVSTSGGTAGQWSKDGRELLIWTSGQQSYTVGSIYSVDVQTTPSFKAGTPRLLFTPRQDLAGIVATADLKRFLAAVPVEGSAPPSITVMLNWQPALRRQ